MQYIYDKYISDGILDIVDCYFRHTLDSFVHKIYITEIVIDCQGSLQFHRLRQKWSGHFFQAPFQTHLAYSVKETPSIVW